MQKKKVKNKPILRRRLVIICIIIVIFSAHSYQHLGVETIRKSKLTKSRLPGARLITATILGDDGASLNRERRYSFIHTVWPIPQSQPDRVILRRSLEVNELN